MSDSVAESTPARRVPDRQPPVDVEKREQIWAQHLTRRARETEEHELRYLFLEVTRACNLACTYCGSSCGKTPQSTELTVNQWLAAIQQVATDFEPKRIMVAVTGGEPLLKPGLFEILFELKRLGFPYGMVTNGVLLDLTTAQRLIQAGIGSISLSLDAPPELNDRQRGRGTFDAVVRAIKCLKEAGFEGKLELITTVTAPAVKELEAMRQVVSALRVPLWRVAPVMPIGRAAERPELVPGPQEIRQILEFVLAARSDDYVPSPEMSEEGYLGNRFEGNVRPYLCQCRAGVSIAGILNDGRIGACPELGDAFVQGDILKERLKDVWEQRYQVLRDRSWMKQGRCADCSEYARCDGGAVHLRQTPESEPLRCLYLLAKEGGG